MVQAQLIKGGSTTFLSSGSTALLLPNITSEIIKKSNSLIRVPFPLADSNDAIMADLLGCSRDIIIEGTYSNQDNADLYKFVRDLVSIRDKNEATLISGDQSNTGAGKIGYSYLPVVSNMSSTGPISGGDQELIRVYVNDVNITYEGGDANKVRYSMTLYEGSSTNSF